MRTKCIPKNNRKENYEASGLSSHGKRTIATRTAFVPTFKNECQRKIVAGSANIDVGFNVHFLNGYNDSVSSNGRDYSLHNHRPPPSRSAAYLSSAPTLCWFLAASALWFTWFCGLRWSASLLPAPRASHHCTTSIQHRRGSAPSSFAEVCDPPAIAHTRRLISAPQRLGRGAAPKGGLGIALPCSTCITVWPIRRHHLNSLPLSAPVLRHPPIRLLRCLWWLLVIYVCHVASSRRVDLSP